MMRTFEDFLASDLNPRRLSKEQRDVVYSDKATVVSAGAGSGKTTVLSYRYLRLLLLEDGSRRAGVEDILTLTFTRKAASEMYERIFRLIKMLAPCFPVLDREVRSFRKAHISTIDAFAAEIARTDCMRYGITRDFTILDNDERIRLIKDTATSLLADYGPQMAELSKIFNPVEMPSEVFLPLDERFDILSGFDAEDQQCMFSAFLDSLKKDVSGRLLQLLDMLAGSDPPSASSLPDFLDVNSDAYHAKLSRAIRDRDFRSRIARESLAW